MLKRLSTESWELQDREPEHYVFPTERYGAGGDDFVPTVHSVDPTRAIGSWKEAWESARETASVRIRFHDLRHTCVTRMLEGGVPLSVVASLLGWSPATTARRPSDMVTSANRRNAKP
jgi:integrase